MLVPPTQEEINKEADRISLPRREALKFRLHFETVGWKVGRARTPMANWKSALHTWKLIWEERVGTGSANGKRLTETEKDRLMKKVDEL